MESVIDGIKAEERERFIRLSPIERAETMHSVICEIFSILARAEGVSEYEIYKRYLRNNPRHYQRFAG